MIYRTTRQQRGVSLVEALVAMAIMAFGMLAVVGVQSTMRLNSDIAKQRSEATRLAEQELEDIRSFTTVGSGDDAKTEFDSIGSAGPVEKTEFNATYKLTRTVAPPAGEGVVRSSIAVTVTVSWTDRTGADQSVTLRDVLSRADPVLSGMVVAAKRLTSIGRRSQRHPTIPLEAHDLTGVDAGKSIFKPSASSDVAWVFNNATGVITHTCTGVTELTDSLPGTCVALDVGAHLLAGEVRFNLRGATLDLGTESVMKPIPGDTVAWVIENSTKKLVRRCTVSASKQTTTLTTDDVSGVGCIAHVVAITPFDAIADPTHSMAASDSENPLWPALPFKLTVSFTDSGDHTLTCFNKTDKLDRSAVDIQKAPYFCLVTGDSDQKWSGTLSLQARGFLDLVSPAWAIGTDAGQYTVCRYTQASSDTTSNADHPRTYVDVTGNLINQNFLVIAGGKTCPLDATGANPLGGDLFNSNTRRHQPAP